jgi:hypothetical protein
VISQTGAGGTPTPDHHAARPGTSPPSGDLTPSPVSSHLARIRETLGVRTTGEVIPYAFRAGLAPEP